MQRIVTAIGRYADRQVEVDRIHVQTDIKDRLISSEDRRTFVCIEDRQVSRLDGDRQIRGPTVRG